MLLAQIKQSFVLCKYRHDLW